MPYIYGILIKLKKEGNFRMKESNLIICPEKLNPEKALHKKQRLSVEALNYRNLNVAFIEKSAQYFANSILSEELYQELRPKKEKEKGNLTHI